MCVDKAVLHCICVVAQLTINQDRHHHHPFWTKTGMTKDSLFSVVDQRQAHARTHAHTHARARARARMFTFFDFNVPSTA